MSTPQETNSTPTTTIDNHYPQPPILHDHLRAPTDPSTSTLPSIFVPANDPTALDPIPLPPSHPDYQQQLEAQQNNTHQQQQHSANVQYRVPSGNSSSHYQTMPINDPKKATIAFDMYVPTQSNPQYQQNHPLGCDCCPHHHKRRDGAKVLYKHLKQPTWGQYIKDKVYLTWEFIKHSYWHLEPWVVRPLFAGIAYNIGIQLARVCIQHFFPTFFPTTVYLPLRANAKFYDLHAKRVQMPVDELPLDIPAPLPISTEQTTI